MSYNDDERGVIIVYERHNILFEPNESDILWKYMSLPKFLNLLNGKLYFNRIDSFEDVFEATFPKYNELHRDEVYGGKCPIPQQSFDDVVFHAQRNTYVSCFHKNEYESAFMWKLYAGENGVAFVTSFKRLRESFCNERNRIYISDVKYIDYENEYLPEGNLFYLSIHKRKSFSHENEVRCIYLSDASNADKPTGMLMAVDLKKLIEKVYISPYAPAYMRDDIENILRSKGIDAEVIYSPLYTIK